jgi:predicted short-subunit dehydrogenase-like oxidoreductase (DUF2520 family)
MTYTLIGAGNMAWLIASRMQSAGHACLGAWGRNPAATEELCAAFALPRLATPDPDPDSADACILAVADSAVPEIAAAFSLRNTTLIHTAGTLSIDVVAAGSVHAGVIWPVYSIRKYALPDHRNFAALIEANTGLAATSVRMIADAICDTSYEADGEQRRWLHLAAVMGNNFVNHLLGIVADICTEQKLPLSLLQPLLDQTLSGMYGRHPGELQTGPARRHDLETMDRHLSMLAAHPQWRILYTALSKAIMDRFPLLPKG